MLTPNRSLSDIGSDHGISRTMVSKILKNYYGEDWQKPKKFYECQACRVMFHGWDKHYGSKAIYCTECVGKYKKGEKIDKQKERV